MTVSDRQNPVGINCTGKEVKIMDVAQILCSTGVPGAGSLPSSPELPLGASTSSPLFREMFARASSAVPSRETMGRGHAAQQSVASQLPSSAVLSANGKGSTLFSAGVALSGESVPERAQPPADGFADVESANALQQQIALRQMKTESGRTLDQRSLSTSKGQEGKGNVLEAGSGNMQEAAILTDPELLVAMDVSPQANLVGGAETLPSAEVGSKQETMEEGKPASEALSTGIAAGLVSQPVMQSLPIGINLGSQAASTSPPLPEAAAPVARAVVSLVRENHAEAWGDDAAWMESRPVAKEGIAELLQKSVGFVSGKPAVEVDSAMQGEVPGLSEISHKQQGTLASQNAVGLRMTEGEVDATVAGLATPALSSEVTERDGKVVEGNTLDGEKLFKAVRHENGSSAGISPRDMKTVAKGETVLRELPSGVTVQNPGQSVTMGRHAASADAQTANASTVVAQTSANGRITLPEREPHDETRVETPVTAESGKVVQKKEGFSFQDNSNLNHDSASSGKDGDFTENSVSAGSLDTVIKDRPESLSEVSPEKEMSALRENVLSQVRDKLANQEPVGNAGKISLKLNPRELGELQITIRLEDQKMSVDIAAQNPLVKEALLQNIDQLKDTLLRHNISMQRFDVSAGAGQEQNLNQSFREGRQAAQHGPEHRSHQFSRYYREESPVTQVAYGEARTSSLVDMRF